LSPACLSSNTIGKLCHVSLHQPLSCATDSSLSSLPDRRIRREPHSAGQRVPLSSTDCSRALVTSSSRLPKRPDVTIPQTIERRPLTSLGQNCLKRSRNGPTARNTVSALNAVLLSGRSMPKHDFGGSDYVDCKVYTTVCYNITARTRRAVTHSSLDWTVSTANTQYTRRCAPSAADASMAPSAPR
jgi:hypothetical protein